MADLGLAIAGVVATGAAIAKGLYELYRSVISSHKDAQDIATHIEFVNAALRVLRQTLQQSDGIESEAFGNDIQLVLSKCRDIFHSVSKVTNTITPRSGGNVGPVTRFGGKVQWFFKKTEVKLLIARLDSIQTSINLMVSTVTLGLLLRDNDARQLSPDLKAGLSKARETVQQGKSTLATLASIEEEYFDKGSNGDEDEEDDKDDEEEQSNRIHAWLCHVIGLNQQDSAGDRSQHGYSVRSAITLSEAQRSITGAATDDVESLLEKWTTLWDGKSTRTRDKGDMESTISYSEPTGSKGLAVISVISEARVSDEEYDDTYSITVTSQSSGHTESEEEEKEEEDADRTDRAGVKPLSQIKSKATHTSNLEDEAEEEDEIGKTDLSERKQFNSGSNSESESVFVQRSSSRKPAAKRNITLSRASPGSQKVNNSKKSSSLAGKNANLANSSQNAKKDTFTVKEDKPTSNNPVTKKSTTRDRIPILQDDHSTTSLNPEPLDDDSNEYVPHTCGKCYSSFIRNRWLIFQI
jgi:hypothetical protein